MAFNRFFLAWYLLIMNGHRNYKIQAQQVLPCFQVILGLLDKMPSDLILLGGDLNSAISLDHRDDVTARPELEDEPYSILSGQLKDALRERLGYLPVNTTEWATFGY